VVDPDEYLEPWLAAGQVTNGCLFKHAPAWARIREPAQGPVPAGPPPGHQVTLTNRGVPMFLVKPLGLDWGVLTGAAELAGLVGGEPGEDDVAAAASR